MKISKMINIERGMDFKMRMREIDPEKSEFNIVRKEYIDFVETQIHPLIGMFFKNSNSCFRITGISGDLCEVTQFYHNPTRYFSCGKIDTTWVFQEKTHYLISFDPNVSNGLDFLQSEEIKKSEYEDALKSTLDSLAIKISQKG